MVPRYTRPEMAAIWAPENRYRIWFEIEALAAEAMAELGTIPAEAARTIREKGGAKAAANFSIAAPPFSRMARAASAGIWPSPAIASAARASISNQMRKRLCGAQMAAIAGRV